MFLVIVEDFSTPALSIICSLSTDLPFPLVKSDNDWFPSAISYIATLSFITSSLTSFSSWEIFSQLAFFLSLASRAASSFRCFVKCRKYFFREAAQRSNKRRVIGNSSTLPNCSMESFTIRNAIMVTSPNVSRWIGMFSNSQKINFPVNFWFQTFTQL